MQNNYILINKNNEILSFYYGEERSIYYKKLDYSNNSIITKVIQDVTDYFTVDITPSKDIYIFCQNYIGDVILCKLEKDKFKHKILFKNKNERAENILFYPIFFKNNLSLIYNTPDSNQSFLSIKTLINNKNWTNSENIDLFSILPNNTFYIQKITQDNIILAYQKKSKDTQIGYKQIKNGNISDFITIHRTNYQIVDYSFVSFNDITHYVYIVKNLFSSQVIYRKKDEYGLSNPITLFDGQKIKTCNINILNNDLYCSFIVNNTLYYCQSENLGRSFLGIVKYKKPISQDVVKAKFLDNINIPNNCINEIFIDSKNISNIYMLPELLPNLFKKEAENTNSYYTKNIKDDIFITDLNNHFIDNNTIPQFEQVKNTEKERKTKNIVTLENDFFSNFNLEEFSKYNIPKETFSKIENFDNISILENKLKNLNQQIIEKNNQILKLNDIIQNKNNEKIEIESNLRQKIKNMEEENNNLLNKIERLNNSNTKSEVSEVIEENEQPKKQED